MKGFLEVVDCRNIVYVNVFTTTPVTETENNPGWYIGPPVVWELTTTQIFLDFFIPFYSFKHYKVTTHVSYTK